MKRKLIMILMAVCILVGCVKEKQEKPLTTESVKVSEKSEEPTKPLEDNKIDIASLEKTLNKFDGVLNVTYVSNNKLLVVADQMYLIDIISGEIVASTPECNYAIGEIKVYSNDTNIIIIGKESRSTENKKVVWDDEEEDSSKESILYYDYQLNLVQNINIYDTFGINPDFVQYVAVSKTGKLAVYDDEQRKLYLCDPETNEKKKILGKSGGELVYDNKIQFSISGGIEFVQDDERIAFKADCLDYPLTDGAEGICGIGSVSIDGKEYYVEKAGDEYAKVDTYNDYSILSQECGFTNPIGKVVKYIFKSDSIETIDLATNEESNNVYCSDNGNILAASEEIKGKGWNIRFYDADSGEMLKEQIYDKVSSEHYRNPSIYVFDDLNAAIVLFTSKDGSDKDEFVVMQL